MDANNVAQLGIFVNLVYRCIFSRLRCRYDAHTCSQPEADSLTLLSAGIEIERGSCVCCRSLL